MKNRPKIGGYKRTQSFFQNLTPKGIIFNAIKEKLEGTGIQKIVLIFNLETDKYNVMLSTSEGKNMKLDITADEITTLKKLFIRRIVSRWNERYDDTPKDVIIEVNILTDELNIFIQNNKDEVLKFDY